MRKPSISTAIPKRRYKFGAYTITVLGDIESDDNVDYEYLLAAVKDGHPHPEVYITCEKATAAETDRGTHIVRVFATQLGGQRAGKIIDQADTWKDQEAFIAYAISGFRQMLQLQDEQVILLS